MIKTIHSTAYQELIYWLKTSRESQGLSMRDLAEALDVPHSWIGKVEQMERRLDTFEYVLVCNALGLNPKTGIDKLCKYL